MHKIYSSYVITANHDIKTEPKPGNWFLTLPEKKYEPPEGTVQCMTVQNDKRDVRKQSKFDKRTRPLSETFNNDE
jgi:hypothetical protein